MKKILDSAEISSAWLCDNCEIIQMTTDELELFISSLTLNLRASRMSAQTLAHPENAVPEIEPADVKKLKKKGTNPKKEKIVDLEPCDGKYEIAPDSKCNTKCTEKPCKEKIEKKLKNKKEKVGRVLDKFGYDVSSNTGKMNVLLAKGEFTRKDIAEQLSAPMSSVNVHISNLKKKGFNLKTSKEGKLKLTKPMKK